MHVKDMQQQQQSDSVNFFLGHSVAVPAITHKWP